MADGNKQPGVAVVGFQGLFEFFGMGISTDDRFFFSIGTSEWVMGKICFSWVVTSMAKSSNAR